MGYSEEQKLEIIQLFYKNNNNVLNAQAEYHRIHPGEQVPTRSTFHYIERNFRERKTLRRKKRAVILNRDEELEILLYFQGK